MKVPPLACPSYFCLLMLFPGCSFLGTLMTFVALTAAFVLFLRAVLRRFFLEPRLRLKRGTIIFPLSPLDAASMRSLAHGRLKAVEEKGGSNF